LLFADSLDQNDYRHYKINYSIVDMTVGNDTLINTQLLETARYSITSEVWDNYERQVTETTVTNGFQFIIENPGLTYFVDNIFANGIKDLEEIKGPGGIELEEPANIAGSYNSSGNWRILALDQVSGDSIITDQEGILKAINWQRTVNQNIYEIRFTSQEEGSEYYLTGYSSPHNPKTAAWNDDPKASGKVPFQVWDLGIDTEDTSDDFRLMVKILDKTGKTFHITDSTWTQFPENDSLYANMWEAIYAYLPVDSIYPDVLPETSVRQIVSGARRFNGRLGKLHKLGHIVIDGELPLPGSVVRIDTWKPLSEADTFLVAATAPVLNDYAGAKKKLDQISVFPNPYFGTDPFGRFPDRNYMRFTDLPQKVVIRIFTLSGQLVKKIEKESDSPWLDWDLRNRDGKAVASGIYIAHLEMPKIGKKVLKLAVVQDNR